jgi:WD40 repeat protein
VRLWDPATGTAVATLTAHTSVVDAVAFSPNGRQLTTVGRDHTVRLWDVNTAEALSLLRLDTGIRGLTWTQGAIALAKAASAVVLDVLLQ